MFKRLLGVINASLNSYKSMAIMGHHLTCNISAALFMRVTYTVEYLAARYLPVEYLGALRCDTVMYNLALQTRIGWHSLTKNPEEFSEFIKFNHIFSLFILFLRTCCIQIPWYLCALCTEAFCVTFIFYGAAYRFFCKLSCLL